LIAAPFAARAGLDRYACCGAPPGFQKNIGTHAFKLLTKSPSAISQLQQVVIPNRFSGEELACTQQHRCGRQAAGFSPLKWFGMTELDRDFPMADG